MYGFFVQDDWRIGESLTLNLGIRYDYEDGVLSNVPYGVNGFPIIEDPRSPYFGQGNCRGEFNGVQNSFCLEDDSNNWAPRLGFAYDIGAQGQTVIRGGWGRFYNKIVANATLFTFIDAVGVRGVSILGDPGDMPFGPDNVARLRPDLRRVRFSTPVRPHHHSDLRGALLRSVHDRCEPPGHANHRLRRRLRAFEGKR